MNHRHARLLLLASIPLAMAACTEVQREAIQRSPYYPDRLTLGSGVSYDPATGCVDKIAPSVSLSWRLKPAEVTPAPTASPAPRYAPGEGEAP